MPRILIAIIAATPLLNVASCEAAPFDDYDEIIIEGEDAPNGVYDPSLEYGPDGIGWMSYSAVKAGRNSRVETRIARSDDNGATWRRVASVNYASPATATLPDGGVASGVWWHETSTLVHNPGDAGREWKLFYHRYLSRQPHRGPNDRKFAAGWIALKTAPSPEGPWSEETALFGAGPFPVAPYKTRLKIGDLHSDLAHHIILTEPGSLQHEGALYLSLQAIRNPALSQGKVLADTILLVTRDHGASWEYVATILKPEDAHAHDGDWFTGSALAAEDGRHFLLVSPEQVGNEKTGHRGTVIFEFENIATGRLKRDKHGSPTPINYLPPHLAKGGQADYDEQNTAGGIVMPQSDLKNLPRPFRIFNTGETITGE